MERGWAAWSVALACALAILLLASSAASAETRTLKLHFTHTNERAEVTFKRNGRFIREGLDKINWILRDWRRNEKTEMDPRLLDLLWEVYQQTGSRAYIHVISAYRSPATNQMLRSRSSGVADNSQHTQGRAIDFFLPDVPVQRLRDLGLRHHGGGVGFYPRSGSPFVHLDTGSVRHWPRMNRQQLMAVFPDGRTMHVPSDGKPLPGYQQAVAAYEARRRGQSSIQVASAGSSSASASGSGNGTGLLAALFRGGSQSGSSGQAASQATAPSSVPTPSAPVRQAEPEPASPQTILAALPAERVPLPMAAPRPSVPVGGQAQQMEVAQAQAIPFEVRDEAEIADELEQRGQTQVAVNVPLPVARPERAPVSALAPESRATGADAIEELLAAQAETVVAEVPVPQPRHRPALVETTGATSRAVLSDEAGERPVVLASLPRPVSDLDDLGSHDPMDKVDALAAKARGASAANDSRLAPISAAASPRSAIMERQAGTDVVAALDSGVRTTARSARPSQQDIRARQRRANVRPTADGELARRALDANTITLMTDGTRAPSFTHDGIRRAPGTVYTAGFQQFDAGDTRRFSGQAVQFMSVARFGGN